MDGLKANVKARQGGSHLNMWKNGNEFLQARWLKCSRKVINPLLGGWAFEKKEDFLYVCIFCSDKEVGHGFLFSQLERKNA